MFVCLYVFNDVSSFALLTAFVVIVYKSCEWRTYIPVLSKWFQSWMKCFIFSFEPSHIRIRIHSNSSEWTSNIRSHTAKIPEKQNTEHTGLCCSMCCRDLVYVKNVAFIPSNSYIVWLAIQSVSSVISWSVIQYL